MEGVHYAEKYSPTPATASIRMLLAMAAAKDGELRHFDAEQAFLKADIDEEVSGGSGTAEQDQAKADSCVPQGRWR